MEETISKAAMLKGMLQGGHSSTNSPQHSGLTIGTGLPIGAPVKTVGDVLALIQKYVGGGGGGSGQQGPSGPQGLQGPQGETGSMGPAGPEGPIGPEGPSAYEVALIEGFVGTEAEWLASLVGPQGPQGIQGEPGPAGGVTSLDDLTDVDLTTPPTDGQILVFDDGSGTWLPVSQPTTSPVDLSVYIAGMPEAEEVIHRAVLARELTLAGNMAGSYAYVGVNPTTAAAAFLIKRNGSSIGQVIIGTSGTASFTTNGPGDPQVFAAGDLLEVTAPTTQNASMADISITLAFTREV